MKEKEVEAIKDVLLEWFNQYQKGNLFCQSVGIEKYHRRALTESLVKFI